MYRKSRKVALMGLLFALACTLSFLESLIPTAGLLPPGVKLGLSNIVTMFAMLFLGFPSAGMIAILKSLFVFLLRGAVAGFMSFSGGLLSIVIMGFLIKNKNRTYTLSFISICGAIGHNLGQMIASSLILLSMTTFAYTPILVLSGVFMGWITSTILFALLPFLKRIASLL